jgi:hypothetical protein
MLIFELEREYVGKDGARKETCTIYAPETAEEITLKDFVDYNLTMQSEAPEALKEAISAETEEEKNELIANWTAIDWQDYYIFIGKVVSTVIYMQKGDKKVKGDMLTLLSMKKGSPMPDVESEADSLFALYSMINQIIASYEPKETEFFIHKGKRFKMPDKFIDNYERTMYAPNISTIEAIEALQIEHVFSAKSKEGEFFYKDRYYHTDLGVMAAICREVNEAGEVIEQLPLDMHQRNKFIQNRMKFFEDISMSVGRDVDFFLQTSKKTLLRTHQLGQRLRTLTVIFEARRALRK